MKKACILARGLLPPKVLEKIARGLSSPVLPGIHHWPGVLMFPRFERAEMNFIAMMAIQNVVKYRRSYE